MDRKIVELLLNGRSYNSISRMLHVGKIRIRRLFIKAVAQGYLAKDGKAGAVALPAYPAALFVDEVDLRTERISDTDKHLEQYGGWIKERLEAGWHAVTVFEELPVKGVGRSAFYRYLGKHGLGGGSEQLRCTYEIIHKPGEALIVDWCKLCWVNDPVTGKKRLLWAFVGVLGYSRKMMIRLVWRIDVKTTLLAIESMFRESGGVPFKITTDNPKCFATTASKYEPLLNPAAERFASHYGFVLECLPPREPKKKGKVERMMPYARRLYEAHGDWKGLEESQEYFDKKLVLANARRHGTTLRQPEFVFNEEEQKALRALPVLGYEPEDFAEGTVRQDSYVRYAGKYYSVDDKYKEKEVAILANSKTVSIYYEMKLLEVHERITDPNRTKATKSHHLKPWERTLEDGAMYRRRAAALGPHVAELTDRILKQGEGFMDTRKIWGILSLDKRYDGGRIDSACRRALELDSPGYRSVLRLLEIEDSMELEYKATEEGKRERNYVQPPTKYIRPMSVYAAQLTLPLHIDTVVAGVPVAEAAKETSVIMQKQQEGI